MKHIFFDVFVKLIVAVKKTQRFHANIQLTDLYNIKLKYSLLCLKCPWVLPDIYYNKSISLVITAEDHICERWVAGQSHLGLNNWF